MPRIQHKRGTSANLASVNPTPLAGELVWDSTENAIKIGDGATAWSSLAYVTATPRSHVHDGADIATGTVAYARLPVGSTTSTVCAGDDARLTDARTPTAHKASHATGGSDALTPADIGAAPAASPAITGNATFSASSGVPVTITNTGSDNSFVVNDAAGDTTPFLIDASGNVGILRSTPTVPLTFSNAVAAPATPSKEEQTNKIRLYDDGTYQFGFGISTGSINIAANGGNLATMRFWTDSVERMRITAAGLVGIGRTAPATALDVNGVITVSATSGSAGSYLPSVTFSGDANTGFGQVSGQSDTASVFTAGHERVRVASDGKPTFSYSATTAMPSTVSEVLAGAAATIFNTSDSATHSGVVLRTRTTGSAIAFVGLEYKTTFSDGEIVCKIRNGSGTTIEPVRIKPTGAVRFVPLSADPASGEAGDVYYNSSTNKLRVYNGTSWIDLH